MKKMIFECPLGPLLLAAEATGIRQITFLEEEKIRQVRPESSPILSRLFEQLEEYFAGNRTAFDLPLDPEGTEFQKKIWRELLHIPYGSTITYGELSERVGDKKAVRAIGKANGQNPLPIIIPCHRVVGSNNDLVGYSGGIERKRWLLQHEGALLL